jgi:hypothetical protein
MFPDVYVASIADIERRLDPAMRSHRAKEFSQDTTPFPELIGTRAVELPRKLLAPEAFLEHALSTIGKKLSRGSSFAHRHRFHPPVNTGFPPIVHHLPRLRISFFID